MNKVLLCLLVLVLAPGLSEACQQYRDVVHDRHGNVLTSASITVTRTGASNPATIYTDPECVTTSANPIFSGTTGEFIFYALDGQYDIAFTKSGYTFIDITNLAIYDPLGQHVVTLGSFETDDICAPGIGAIDQIGANVKELVINRPATCSESKTSPSNLTIRGEGQGDVTTASPLTLTVNGPVKIVHGRDFWKGTGTYVFGTAAGPTPYGYAGIVEPAYGAEVAIDAALGRTFIVVPTDGVAFELEQPDHPATGQEIRITIKNTTGGVLGAATFNSNYKLGAVWTQPATAFSRSIVFYYNGTNWIESHRSSADIAN